MEYKNTLVQQLSEYIDENHIDKVKELIDTMLEIEKTKVKLQICDDVDELYQQLRKVLKTKFSILEFKIIRFINGVEQEEFSTQNSLELNFEYSYKITEEVSMMILLNNEHLNEFGQKHLCSYLDEVLNIIYMKLILHSLEDVAYIDPLTKLKNRNAFNQDMKEIVPLALRENMKIGVVIIDIDRFRAVNDEHGTDFGDKFLELYSYVLQDTLRSSDIAVRFGGGQFLVLYMNIIDEETTLKLALQLQKSLEDAFLITSNNDQFKKTVSMGIAMFPHDSQDMHEVVHFANMALSDAKDKGRSQVLQYKCKDGNLDIFF